MRTVAWAMIALPIVTGCAQLRAEFVPPTGEPMRIHDRTLTKTGVHTVATGQDEIRDSTGHVVATTTHYQNQQFRYREREWYPVQGSARIDDESFYRITNDSEATQKYLDYHTSARRKSNAGLIVGSIGLGLLVGSIGLAAAGAARGDREFGYALGGAGTVGFIAGIVGYSLFLVGRKAASAQDVRLIEEPERMKADAQRYNAQLAVQPIR